MSFSEELVRSIEALWTRYPHRQAALIPALHLVQKAHGGWIPMEAIRRTAELFGLPDAQDRKSVV